MVIEAMKLKDACLLLGRKVMTNLDSILKSRDITLPIKVRLVKAMAFPVVLYGKHHLVLQTRAWGMNGLLQVLLLCPQALADTVGLYHREKGSFGPTVCFQSFSWVPRGH